MPLRDSQVTGPTGGAFGSAHSQTWNALFADWSVRPVSYSIDPAVFTAIGTINGNEGIDESQLDP
jgi:hypothetical protein